MDNLANQPAPPVPWTLRDVLWGLLFFGLWILFFALAGLVSQKLSWPIDTSLLIVFGEAVLLLPVWYLALRRRGAAWADLGLRGFRPAAVGLGCGLMLLSLLFNLVYAAVLGLFNLQMQPDIQLLFTGTDYPLAVLFGGAIVAPFVEEVFFRGFIFAGLRQRWDWKKAALASSALFALFHVMPTSLAPIFILGLIFAFLYQVSGSIWPAILMHMLTNSVALLAAYALSQGWLSAT
jgi:hypothetical protein